MFSQGAQISVGDIKPKQFQRRNLKILVEGVVVERGSHDELLTADGVYADLWAVQTGDLEQVTGQATMHDD